jgi:hypothetical protein
MKTSYDKGTNKYLLALKRDELIAINNALNEVCNGINIADSEFKTRLGIRRKELGRLLEEVRTLLDAT